MAVSTPLKFEPRSFPTDSCAPAHLKLVRFPARSPLPIATLPSMRAPPGGSIRSSLTLATLP